MISSKLSDYDRRQPRVMRDKIVLFKREKIDLSYLINDLEALCGLLESVDESWMDDFHSEWENLEINYSIAAAEERDCLSIREKEEVKMSLTKIEQLIANLGL